MDKKPKKARREARDVNCAGDSAHPPDRPRRSSEAQPEEDHVTDDRAGGLVKISPSSLQLSGETSKYLSEVVAHLASLPQGGGGGDGAEGEEEDPRMLLVNNVLEELAGAELKAAMDAVCSRHLEALLYAADATQLLRFLGPLIADAASFCALVTSPFGSHVAEKVLIRLELLTPGMGAEEHEACMEVLTNMTGLVCELLTSLMCDRYGTHLPRRLLCLLAGRDVLPPRSGNKGDKAPRGASSLANKLVGALPSRGNNNSNSAGAGKKVAALAAAAAAACASGATAAPLPPSVQHAELLKRVASAVCDVFAGGGSEEAAAVVYHPSGSPFLQTLLRAVAYDSAILTTLIPALLGAAPPPAGGGGGRAGGGASLASIDSTSVRDLMADPTASHLLEVIVQVAPRPLFDEFLQHFVVGHLVALAHHRSANFAAQAVIAASKTVPQVKAMFEELRNDLPALLRMRRGGVVAALAAACCRVGCCQRDLCMALQAGLVGQSGPLSHLPAEGVLAPSLMCLDSHLVLGLNEPEGPEEYGAVRLSPLGCSLMSTLLALPQGACRTFTDSLAGLGGNDLARVARDPAGSRCLEALLEGGAPAKVKTGMLTRLAGHWASVAARAPGSYVIEKAYTSAEPDLQEKIASELVAAEKSLQRLHWGPALLIKVGAEAYKRDPVSWRQHAAKATKTLSDFEKLFGGVAAVPAVPAGGKAVGASAAAPGKKGKAPAPAAATAVGASAAATGGTAVEADAQDGGKKRKKARKSKDVEEATATVAPATAIATTSQGHAEDAHAAEGRRDSGVTTAAPGGGDADAVLDVLGFGLASTSSGKKRKGADVPGKDIRAAVVQDGGSARVEKASSDGTHVAKAAGAGGTAPPGKKAKQGRKWN